MSILKHVNPIPPDPIFGLGERVKADVNEKKVDLTVGIYRNEQLQTATMRSVVEAEKKLLQIEKDKNYLPMGGDKSFIQASRTLVFGEAFAEVESNRFMGVQSLGGTSALRIGGELLQAEVSKNLYLSAPTWPNHFGVFHACNMNITTYPYYNKQTHTVDFDQMLKLFAHAPEKSIIVLHTCCHNPTGCDLTKEEWKELSIFMLKHKLIPFFDFAYQGFAIGIEEDPWPIRHFAEEGHELFVAHSFSKFFGLYGERVGALHGLVKDKKTAQQTSTVLERIIRISFSNPPRHGANLVSIIMNDTHLKKMWQDELSTMRQRIKEMRSEFVDALELKVGKDQFDFLKNRYGLFSMLGVENELVDQLIKNYSIYLTKSGRINLTGLNQQNIPYVVNAIVNSIS